MLAEVSTAGQLVIETAFVADACMPPEWPPLPTAGSALVGQTVPDDAQEGVAAIVVGLVLLTMPEGEWLLMTTTVARMANPGLRGDVAIKVELNGDASIVVGAMGDDDINVGLLGDTSIISALVDAFPLAAPEFDSTIPGIELAEGIPGTAVVEDMPGIVVFVFAWPVAAVSVPVLDNPGML